MEKHPSDPDKRDDDLTLDYANSSGTGNPRIQTRRPRSGIASFVLLLLEIPALPVILFLAFIGVIRYDGSAILWLAFCPLAFSLLFGAYSIYTAGTAKRNILGTIGLIASATILLAMAASIVLK